MSKQEHLADSHDYSIGSSKLMYSLEQITFSRIMEGILYNIRLTAGIAKILL